MSQKTYRNKDWFYFSSYSTCAKNASPKASQWKIWQNGSDENIARRKKNLRPLNNAIFCVYISVAIKPAVSEETIFKAEAMIIFRCHFHSFHFRVVVNFSCERVNFHSFIIFLTWFYITKTKFKIKSTTLRIMYLIDLRRLDNGFSEVFEFLDRRTVSGLLAFVRLSEDFLFISYVKTCIIIYLHLDQQHYFWPYVQYFGAELL